MSDAPLSLARRRAITSALLLGMSLGALEATVVSTALPTVVLTLGGLAHYSWVFSAYLLTSTASVPIWGRLSDLYGHRRLYLIGIAVFLVGSALSGAAVSMPQLIAFRAIQGLGAGAIIPLGMTIIGELYTLQERARVQAIFSGVWGVASIAGPLVGGYITDALSWRWVFLLNLPVGLLAAVVLASAYPASRRQVTVPVDWLGATLLFAGVTSILIALSDVAGSALPWMAATAVLFALFTVVERRVVEPILPLDLFRDKLVTRTLVVVFLVGAAMLGSIAFVPLFVQGVMGGTATAAGQALTPLFLGWVIMSVLSARLVILVSYRPTTTVGAVLLVAGYGALSLVGVQTSRAAMYVALFVLGCGLGLSLLSLLLAIQHGVDRSRLGLATSLNQFFRSVGSVVGVALMGALLARGLAGVVSPDALGAVEAGAAPLDALAREALAEALRGVFRAGAALSGAAVVACWFLPSVDFSRGAHQAAGEILLAAEMASLESEGEPDVVGG
ncbi:MAG: MFS transporter [Gemmatimonadetes bacterium]|nr:MFS transporter [Gemmatimonadota bacterium]